GRWKGTASRARGLRRFGPAPGGGGSVPGGRGRSSRGEPVAEEGRRQGRLDVGRGRPAGVAGAHQEAGRPDRGSAAGPGPPGTKLYGRAAQKPPRVALPVRDRSPQGRWTVRSL
ncbi:MAG: hypothetical protein AVDCRST_MAG78-777, partial [uncultured Rubrobacteraceae bacterium]